MWHLDYKESWAPKNWCFWTVVLEKTLESPLDCKKIQPVHPKGNQSWIFIGRTDVEAETPILWPPDAKNWLIWKDPDVGKGEGEDRGWDGWMASPTQWTWVWVNSGSWWWTGRPGVLQSMGSQRVGHNRATVLNLFIALHRYCFKKNWRFVALLNWHYFSNSFCLFCVSVPHFGNYQNISNFCIIIFVIVIVIVIFTVTIITRWWLTEGSDDGEHF